MHAARTLGFAVDGRSDDEFIEDLYQLATGRPADDAGRRWLGQMLDQGADRLSVTMTLAHSEEALNRQLALRTHIQDLRELRPASFRTVPGTDGVAREVYRADTAEDVDWMEESILEHGYYEKPGIWSLSVDDDKRRMSALLASFAPTRALEIGCSSGTVMEGLLAAGVDCDGLEISRMAIQRADPAVRPRIHRADLLDADLTDGYDLIYGLDVLEHLNPNRFDRYLVRLRELVSDTGYVYVNSPAFGVDDVYGEEFPWSFRAGRRTVPLAGCSVSGWSTRTVTRPTGTSSGPAAPGGRPRSRRSGSIATRTSSARSTPGGTGRSPRSRLPGERSSSSPRRRDRNGRARSSRPWSARSPQSSAGYRDGDPVLSGR